MLLLTLLNHAVLACDSVVVHWPKQHHNVSGIHHLLEQAPHHHSAMSGQQVTDQVSNQVTEQLSSQHQPSSGHSMADDDAEPHGHVLCFVAYQPLPPQPVKVLDAIVRLPVFAPTLHQAPPVPPPNC